MAQANDATLSALALTDRDGNAVALDRAFASDVNTYAASVADNVWRVTVTPTKTDANATVDYLDGDDAELTDADGNGANGFQVDLDVGDTVIRVEVEAADGMDTRTYQVTVTRAPYACETPDLSGREHIWSATMTVGGDAFGNLGYVYPNLGSLSDRSFTHTGGTDYEVNEFSYSVVVASTELYFQVLPGGGISSS